MTPFAGRSNTRRAPKASRLRCGGPVIRPQRRSRRGSRASMRSRGQWPPCRFSIPPDAGDHRRTQRAMIVVDSSCLLAILQNEPEKDVFRAVLAGGDRCLMSAVNVHEALCVMRGRYGVAGAARFWDLIGDTEIEIVPFDELQVAPPLRRSIGMEKASTRSRPEFLGLRGLRPRQDDERAPAVQGQRFHGDGRDRRHGLNRPIRICA